MQQPEMGQGGKGRWQGCHRAAQKLHENLQVAAGGEGRSLNWLPQQSRPGVQHKRST